MQKHLAFFIILFIGVSSIAQLSGEEIQQIDSLKEVISTAKYDTIKVNALIAWDNIIYVSDPELDLELNKQIIEICESNLTKQLTEKEKQKYKKGIASALNNIGSIYFNQGEYAKAIDYFTRILKIEEEIGDKDGITDALTYIGIIYQDKGDYAKAIDYYTKSLKIEEGIGDKDGIADALNNIGIIYDVQGDYTKAMDYYTKSLKIKEELGNKKEIANCLNEIGNIYFKKGDVQSAIETYKEVVDICKENNNPKGISNAYTEIGVIQKLLGESGKRSAIEYFHKSLEIRKEIKWNAGIGWNLKDIASTYKDLQEYDSALYYIEKAIDVFEKTNNKKDVGYSLLLIAQVHYNKKNHSETLKYLTESKEIFKGLNYLSGIIECNKLLADVLIKDEKYKEALPYIDQAEEHFKNSFHELKGIYNSSYIIYKNLGNNNKALEYLEKYKLLADSLNKDELNKSIIQIEFDNQHKLDSISFVKAKEAEQIQHQAEILANETDAANKRMFLYAGIGVLLLLSGIGFWSFYQKKKDNRIIRARKAEVDEAYEKLEEKNNDILDSVNYAKRIQSAILPPQKSLKEHLENSFVLYLPKDIVAGDFYWMETINNMVLFAVADCTGHGIPGAMVSVIGNNALNRSVREHGLTEPGKILDRSRALLIQEFQKSEEEVKDGMDIALCMIRENELSFAGANNPLWIVRNGELLETRGDSQPIGKFDHSKPFTTHEFELQKGDTIYIFSDGFADQFGGEKGKKFKKLNFKKLLLSVEDKPIAEHKRIIEETFDSWKGELEQIDDVCVMGVRV